MLPFPEIEIVVLLEPLCANKRKQNKSKQDDVPYPYQVLIKSNLVPRVLSLAREREDPGIKSYFWCAGSLTKAATTRIFQSALEFGPQAWASVRSKFLIRGCESWQVYW